MTPAAAIPEGAVVITPIEMYREQREMNGTLRDVVNKLDGMAVKLDHYRDDQAARMDAIDGKDGEIEQLKRRVGSLERWRWISTGAVAMLSSGATAAVYEAVVAHH